MKKTKVLKDGDVYNPHKVFAGLVIPNPVAKSTEISQSAKLCFGRLIQYAGKDGKCFPKQQTLSEEIGLQSIKQISRCIQELVKTKLIKVKKPTGINKLMHKNDQYVFIWNSKFINVKTKSRYTPKVKSKDVNKTVLRYFDIENSYTDDGYSKEKWDTLQKDLSSCNKDDIADVIKQLDYSLFLKTGYWKIISQHVKHNAGYKCALCGKSKELAAHHKTYKNHGYEHLHWSTDLMCLCSNCHKKAHKIK